MTDDNKTNLQRRIDAEAVRAEKQTQIDLENVERSDRAKRQDIADNKLNQKRLDAIEEAKDAEAERIAILKADYKEIRDVEIARLKEKYSGDGNGALRAKKLMQFDETNKPSEVDEEQQPREKSRIEDLSAKLTERVTKGFSSIVGSKISQSIVAVGQMVIQSELPILGMVGDSIKEGVEKGYNWIAEMRERKKLASVEKTKQKKFDTFAQKLLKQIKQNNTNSSTGLLATSSGSKVKKNGDDNTGFFATVKKGILAPFKILKLLFTRALVPMIGFIVGGVLSLTVGIATFVGAIITAVVTLATTIAGLVVAFAPLLLIIALVGLGLFALWKAFEFISDGLKNGNLLPSFNEINPFDSVGRDIGGIVYDSVQSISEIFTTIQSMLSAVMDSIIDWALDLPIIGKQLAKQGYEKTEAGIEKDKAENKVEVKNYASTTQRNDIRKILEHKDALDSDSPNSKSIEAIKTLNNKQLSLIENDDKLKPSFKLLVQDEMKVRGIETTPMKVDVSANEEADKFRSSAAVKIKSLELPEKQSINVSATQLENSVSSLAEERIISNVPVGSSSGGSYNVVNNSVSNNQSIIAPPINAEEPYPTRKDWSTSQ